MIALRGEGVDSAAPVSSWLTHIHDAPDVDARAAKGTIAAGALRTKSRWEERVKYDEEDVGLARDGWAVLVDGGAATVVKDGRVEEVCLGKVVRSGGGDGHQWR